MTENVIEKEDTREYRRIVEDCDLLESNLEFSEELRNAVIRIRGNACSMNNLLVRWRDIP